MLCYVSLIQHLVPILQSACHRKQPQHPSTDLLRLPLLQLGQPFDCIKTRLQVLGRGSLGSVGLPTHMVYNSALDCLRKAVSGGAAEVAAEVAAWVWWQAAWLWAPRLAGQQVPAQDAARHL